MDLKCSQCEAVVLSTTSSSSGLEIAQAISRHQVACHPIPRPRSSVEAREQVAAART